MSNKIKKFYEDTLHGFNVYASNRTMAWMQIRNMCHEKNLQVPNIMQIKEIK